MAKRSRATNTWIIVGLVAFVVADLALVGFALRGAADNPPASAVEPSFSFSPTPSGIATSAPSPSGTAAPTASAAPTTTAAPANPAATTPASSAPAPTDVVSSMANATVGYRATAGTCDSGTTATDSVIELTTDGGATWTNINPTDIRVRAVEKMLVVDASHVDILARYGDDCTQSDITTYTQGEFWQVYPDRTALFN